MPTKNKAEGAHQSFPKKYLGQNFLIDPRTIQRIIQSCGLSGNETVLEIGPGKGALSRELSKQSKEFYAVEKDQDLHQLLLSELPSSAKLIAGDILTLDFRDLPSDLIVIGNLPYNISTPIIEKLISHRQQIKTVFITVQLEFGQRLAARPGIKDYSSLSCFIQYYADIKILFKISNSCFRPIPKVASCFVQLKFREPTCKAVNENLLFKIIRQAFMQRRKTLPNALKSLIAPEILMNVLDELKIARQARAENLSIDEYVQLSNKLNG